MSYQDVKDSYAAEIAEIKAAGLWKTERVIASEQKNEITLEGGANVVNMCANNYLGLANNAEVMKAASDSLQRWGFGAASVRFICGTQGIHKTLEQRVSAFVGMEDTILYAACFDANGKPMSYCMYPRSSISKTPLRVANCVGIIDSGYRGHLMGMMDNIRSGDFTIDEHTRYLQLCLPSLEPFRVELVETIDDLGFTSRGSGGFGSTGK